VSRRRVVVVDVLAEVRRAMRVLRRAERFLVQQERHVKRLQGELRVQLTERGAAMLAERERKARPLDDGLPL